MSSKIHMKYYGNLPIMTYEIEHNFVEITPALYEDYTKCLHKAGYEKWPHKLTLKRACIYIPQCWFGIIKDRKLVATCAVSFGVLKKMKPLPDSCEIEALAVIPEYRKRGLGTAIVRRVIKATMEHGYKNIFVAVHPERKAAVKTYKKVGFE